MALIHSSWTAVNAQPLRRLFAHLVGTPAGEQLSLMIESHLEEHESSAPNHLECKIADPLWYRQCRPVVVGHRGRYAVRE